VFRGKINFSNVTFKNPPREIKIDTLQLKLGYFNLFRFYISKAEKALKHISSAGIQLRHLQSIDLGTRQKYSVHSATLHQEGNLWDAVQAGLQKTPPQKRHVLDFRAAGINYINLGDSIGTIKSDSVHFHYIFPKNVQGIPQASDSIQISGFTWILPHTYINEFGMFLKGLGLSSDSIGVAQAGFSFSGLNRRRIKIQNGAFKTKPFAIHFNGLILKKIPWQDSKFNPLTIKVVRISNQLKNLLTGFGFLNDSLQAVNNQLTFRLVGPINSPQLKK
jgi:hypothetical protein